MSNNQKDEFRERLKRVNAGPISMNPKIDKASQKKLDRRTLKVALAPLTYLIAPLIGVLSIFATAIGFSIWGPDIPIGGSVDYDTGMFFDVGLFSILIATAHGAATAITIMFGMRSLAHILLANAGVRLGLMILQSISA